MKSFKQLIGEEPITFQELVEKGKRKNIRTSRYELNKLLKAGVIKKVPCLKDLRQSMYVKAD